MFDSKTFIRMFKNDDTTRTIIKLRNSVSWYTEEIIKSKLLTPSQMIPNRSCSKEDLDSLQEESAKNV